MKLLVLPGDGVGPEIVEAALAVLDAAAARLPLELEHETAEIGLAALARGGTTLPEGVLERARAADGVVLGPIDHLRYPERDRGGVNVSASCAPASTCTPTSVRLAPGPGSAAPLARSTW